MDLKSDPFWAIKNGLMRPFPAWHGDGRCDVVVVGAGITGALIADELTQHGHDVIVLDQWDVFAMAYGGNGITCSVYRIATP